MVAELGLETGSSVAARHDGRASRGDDFWGPVRADFEANGLTRAGICLKHGISDDELMLRAKRNKWNGMHRQDGGDRAILMERIFALLERQIANLEKAKMSESGDREATVLGKLVRSLDKLIEIEGQAARRAPRRETREMLDLRKKLAERIERLAKG